MSVKRTELRLILGALVAALALLVSACAPAAGRQSSAPIRVGSSPVAAAGGETIYVRVDYSMDAFNLKESDLNAALWVPSGYASERGDITSSFSLRDVQGATGWDIALTAMRVQRITTRVESFGSETVRYEVWAELRVSIPPEPIPGVYRVRGTLHARGGVTQPLAFSVEVR